MKDGTGVRLPNPPDCFLEVGKATTDSALKPDLRIPITFDQGNINGIFMNIQAYKYANILHDSPPWLWLCAVGLISGSVIHVCKEAGLFLQLADIMSKARGFTGTFGKKRV
jgi:hypothetical protein